MDFWELFENRTNKLCIKVHKKQAHNLIIIKIIFANPIFPLCPILFFFARERRCGIIAGSKVEQLHRQEVQRCVLPPFWPTAGYVLLQMRWAVWGAK